MLSGRAVRFPGSRAFCIYMDRFDLNHSNLQLLDLSPRRTKIRLRKNRFLMAEIHTYSVLMFSSETIVLIVFDIYLECITIVSCNNLLYNHVI